MQTQQQDTSSYLQIDDYMQNSNSLVKGYDWFRKRVFCKDGFNISIQASETHYCSPRTNNGPWWKLELGFPNMSDNLIHEYAEDSNHPTETVYGYVPVDIVQSLLDSHGGIDLEITLA